MMKALMLIVLVAIAAQESTEQIAHADNVIDCKEWRYVVIARSAKARNCEWAMVTDNCWVSSQCEPARPCEQASTCIDPTRTTCGKVHAKCFGGDRAACLAEKQVCAACFKLGDDCTRCSNATTACENEARHDTKCGPYVRALDYAMTIWRDHCVP